MKFVRTDLPVYLGIIGGMSVILAKFIGIDLLQVISRWFLEWRVILAAFAMALGAGNLLRIHTNRVRMRREGWGYSIITLTALIVLFVLGVTARRTHLMYVFLYDNGYIALGATVFSMNAFFIASACYRAFRVRNLAAAILLISGCIVMLGKVGIGHAMWSGFAVWADWIMNVPNAAAMRGINAGAALGVMGVSMRVILGLERGHLGGE